MRNNKVSTKIYFIPLLLFYTTFYCCSEVLLFSTMAVPKNIARPIKSPSLVETRLRLFWTTKNYWVFGKPTSTKTRQKLTKPLKITNRRVQKIGGPHFGTSRPPLYAYMPYLIRQKRWSPITISSSTLYSPDLCSFPLAFSIHFPMPVGYGFLTSYTTQSL